MSLLRVERVNSQICSTVKLCTRFLSNSLLMHSLPNMISYLTDKNGKAVKVEKIRYYLQLLFLIILINLQCKTHPHITFSHFHKKQTRYDMKRNCHNFPDELQQGLSRECCNDKLLLQS